MLKRITALLLAMIMLLGLCACGASSDATPAGTQAGTQAGTASGEQPSSDGDAMSAEEMSAMGDKYYHGDGVEADIEEARSWYLKAAEAGYDLAYLWLGDTYYFSSDEQKDYGKAFEYYSKAADAGIPDALGNLGVMYAGGYGVEQDYVKAAEWYEKAIDAGCGWAARNLGSFYLNGQPGIEKDEEKGLELLNKAIEAGYTDACMTLASYYNLNNDYAKAEENYLKAAEDGNDWAYYNLGNMFLYKVEDLEKAEKYLTIAAEKGINAAKGRLGDLYCGYFGSAKRDYDKAAEWYTKAMESDPPVPYGAVQLGQMYYYGHGVEKDYEKAFELVSLSVELYQQYSPNDGFLPAALEVLAEMYELGHGVEKDEAKAAELREWSQELQNNH